MPALTFIDTAGTRHQLQLSAKDQETLLQQRGRRQQEAWLLEQGYLEPDLPAETPATPDPSEAITALAAMQERLTTLQGQVDTYSTADQLGQLNLDLQKWSAQAARVSLAHAELAALADQTVTTCQSMADAAQARLDQLDGDQATMAAAIASQLTEAQATAAAAITQTTSTIATALADAKAEALSEARAIAAQQQGPTGFAGSGVTIAMENPQETDPTSWAQRWYGRDQLVSGDSALVPTKDALRTFRYTGRAWVEGPAIEPKVVAADVKISALDNSIKQTTTVTNIATGGGGGGGLERLLTNTITQATNTELADSSNWSALGTADPTAGTIWLEVLDPTSAESMCVVCTFDAGATAGNTRVTEYAITGSLSEGPTAPEVQFDARRSGSVRIPASITGIVPRPGSASTLVSVAIGRNLPGSKVYLLRGGVLWMMRGNGQAYLPTDVQPQPAWIWG
jgi:hypothetical protein